MRICYRKIRLTYVLDPYYNIDLIFTEFMCCGFVYPVSRKTCQPISMFKTPVYIRVWFLLAPKLCFADDYVFVWVYQARLPSILQAFITTWIWTSPDFVDALP